MDGITLDNEETHDQNIYQSAILLVCTGILSFLAWHGDADLLAASLCLPAFWSLASNRLTAWLTALVYYLVAARDIPAGADIYFGLGELYGWGLLISASLLLSLPFAVFWRKNPDSWRFLLALLLVSIPPIGIVGWTNPLTAAGVIFPGLGWIGFFITLYLMAKIVRIPALALLVFLCSLIVPRADLQPPTGWTAIDTTFMRSPGITQFLDDARRQRDLIERIKGVRSRVVILPETIAGRWNDASMFLWDDIAYESAQRRQTILFGAEIADQTGYKNVAIRLSPEGGHPLYQQLMPVPISMWRPWATGGATPAWFHQQSAKIDGLTASFLLCYEQLLLWPPLVAMSADPDVLIGLSNGWWARDTDIPAIQISALKAWASLFGTSLIYSVNK
ncbi:MAG: nitrilase-related carbon-nitrogen hydrolase [Sedimenticola sp.]